MAIIGLDAKLTIVLEDKKLTREVYVQILGKIYACTRYKVYQQLKHYQRKKMEITKNHDFEGETGSGMMMSPKDRDNRISIDYDQDMLDLSAEQCASVLGEIDMRRLRL